TMKEPNRQSKKPTIGIPTRFDPKTETFGQIRHYLDAVLDAGGLPLMIPTMGPQVVQEYLDRLDGILLPGSPTDTDPAHYAAHPHPRLGKPYPERDATDFALLEYADKTGLPLLGICFGIQSLNVFRGGKLVQDIPSLERDTVPHDSGNDTAEQAA